MHSISESPMTKLRTGNDFGWKVWNRRYLHCRCMDIAGDTDELVTKCKKQTISTIVLRYYYRQRAVQLLCPHWDNFKLAANAEHLPNGTSPGLISYDHAQRKSQWHTSLSTDEMRRRFRFKVCCLLFDLTQSICRCASEQRAKHNVLSHCSSPPAHFQGPFRRNWRIWCEQQLVLHRTVSRPTRMRIIRSLQRRKIVKRRRLTVKAWLELRQTDTWGMYFVHPSTISWMVSICMDFGFPPSNLWHFTASSIQL